MSKKCPSRASALRSALRRLTAAVLAVLATALSACTSAVLPPERAIVVLVSIDGFRWDYLDRVRPPVLSRLAADGVRADGLIPGFPTLTFPNHYSIVTGLTPAHHGIVGNSMEDPGLPGRFTLNNRDVQADPRWWGGEPIWNTAERQGRIAAAMFWPGSETKIGGHQPTFWTTFDDELPHEKRVEQILAWLRLPDGQRPSFLTLYYSAVDHAGHDDGPDSTATREAVLSVDRSIGALVDGVRQAGLADRVHYVVVSDHGMAAIPLDHFIELDRFVNPERVDVIESGPTLAVNPRDGDVEGLYAALRDKHPALKVFRNREIPVEYGGLAGHPRVAAVVGFADEGWYVTSRRQQARWASGQGRRPAGTHGYDARLKSMQGVFIASGPRLKQSLRAPAFENINVYELLCAILGLTPAPNDGNPAVTREMLR